MAFIEGASGPAPCVEDCAEITTAMLKGAGLFPWGTTPRIELRLLGLSSEYERLVTVESPLASAGAIKLYFQYRGDSLLQQIAILTTNIGFSTRPMFVCTKTGRLVSRLYLYRGELGTRFELGLRHRTQGADRGDRLIANREAAFACLNGEGGKLAPVRARQAVFTYLEFLEIESLLGEGGVDRLEAVRRREEDRISQALAAAGIGVHKTQQRAALRKCASTLTTAAGVALDWSPSIAAGVLEPLLPEIRQQVLSDKLAGHVPGSWPGLQLPRAALEDYPTLEMREVLRRELVQEGELTHWTMNWGELGYDSGHVFMSADLRPGAFPYLAVAIARRLGEPSTHLRQGIALMRPGPHDQEHWAFRDPGLGLRATVLALRDDRFATPKAQSLVYRSQIGRNRARAKVKTGDR